MVTIISENVTGVNIPMLSSYSVVFNNPIVLAWRFKYNDKQFLMLMD